jgi:hypothetical protein
MCPTCLTTTAPAGGLTTLVANKLRARTGAKRSNPMTGATLEHDDRGAA